MCLPQETHDFKHISNLSRAHAEISTDAVVIALDEAYVPVSGSSISFIASAESPECVTSGLSGSFSSIDSV